MQNLILIFSYLNNTNEIINLLFVNFVKIRLIMSQEVSNVEPIEIWKNFVLLNEVPSKLARVLAAVRDNKQASA